MRTPNKLVQQIAREYVASKGFNPIKEGHYVELDFTLAHEIAEAYDNAPAFDASEHVLDAYKQLMHEVQEQYNLVIKYGYTLEPWINETSQPYKNSAEMMHDVRCNMHLWYFTGGDVHPVMGETNNAFRAIHDFFGHVAEGYGFGPRGEENAWIHHSMMFSALAQEALTTETRGQNSWVNFFGEHESWNVIDRPYAEQKVFLFSNRAYYDYWSKF